jgi:hypothetical protein
MPLLIQAEAIAGEQRSALRTAQKLEKFAGRILPS